MSPASTGRDFVGYGRSPPNPHWPAGARLALVIVLNIEEGAEPSIADGNGASELALTDAIAGEVPQGTPDLVAESLWEYGSRVGFWRLHDLFVERGIALTVNACALALERNPQIAAAIRNSGFDLCCHGYRFERHFLLSENDERAVVAKSIASLKRTIGRAPTGWQSRYSASERTRRLLVEHGGFLYDADSYADDLPYWVSVDGRPHLVIPHTFTNNDNRLPSGKIPTSAGFFDHIAAAFRTLYAESARRPRMMTVSLHSRISGQPARFEAVVRFLDLVAGYSDVWISGRSDIAKHWISVHPAKESV